MNLEEEYGELKSKVVERKKDFDDFINFLESGTTWLTAPASVRYHLSVEKGLLQHSVGVTQTLLKIKNLLAPMISDESCVIVGLFHDVGKVGMPHAPRYLKKGDKFVYNKDQVEMQIANRSLYLVSKYVPLSDEEAQAILYHDGQYIAENRFIAHKECPLTLLLTFADTWTCAVDEEGREIKENKNYFRRGEMNDKNDNNHKKENMSTKIAKKHIKICMETKETFQNKYSGVPVFIATHPEGLYRDLGMSSGEDFWSLQLKSFPENKKLKYPDVIVTNGKKVEYFIEVKWGAVEGCSFSNSDIKKIVFGDEMEKMKRARLLGGELSCNGPAIINGHHYKSEEFTHKESFDVNEETKFLLISDFQKMKDVFSVKDFRRYNLIRFLY